MWGQWFGQIWGFLHPDFTKIKDETVAYLKLAALMYVLKRGAGSPSALLFAVVPDGDVEMNHWCGSRIALPWVPPVKGIAMSQGWPGKYHVQANPNAASTPRDQTICTPISDDIHPKSDH